MTCAVKVTDVANQLDPFVRQLLEMDDRFRLCEYFGDIQEDKGFFVTKEFIHVPFILPRIEHDISHLLELTAARRWTMPDWGMPKFSADTIAPSAFFAALCRECRTRGIQLHLQKFQNEEAKLRSTAWNQLNNPYWKEMTEKLLPYGRLKTMQDVQCWLDDLRDRTFNAWSLDRIQCEWKVRLNHIQNWMETA